MSYYVYIMTNKWNTVLYTGVTNDIERRLLEHRESVKKSFTKRYHVNKVVYVEEFKYVNDALAAEKRIKGWTRAKKRTLIESVNPQWKELVLNGDASSRLRGTQHDMEEGSVG